ncbi:MAG: hypothetical protein GF350_02415 [Chitinivibrionales bacterium]|nr:hypothetical protein [Chitinivibrionales bacterium]
MILKRYLEGQMNLFDICIVTASNSFQAGVFRKLIGRRIEHGLYPKEIDFRVYHDPDSGRVGSGGGTLLALCQVLQDYSAGPSGDFFSNCRILIIHAGGESRRLPCYIPEGKIFAPVPVATSSIVPPVVLDLQLSLFLRYPWKSGEVVVISGDAIIDCDTAFIPDDRGGICGFAKSASLEQATNHGVFGFDANKENVVDFYQKASVDLLKREALLEGTDQCALDIGIVSMGPAVAEAFVDFAGQKAGAPETVLKQVRNAGLRFDLYVEIMTACLAGISFEDFVKKTAQQTSLNKKTLRALYKTFHPYVLRGILTKNTTFLHFGTLAEYPRSSLELYNKGIVPFYTQENEEVQPVCTPELVLFNSIDFQVPVARRKTIFAESVRECALSGMEGGNVISGLCQWNTGIVIPEGICIDRRRTGKNGDITLVYSVKDTFKPRDNPAEIVFCGMHMDRWLKIHGLDAGDIWNNTSGYDLFDARLFFAGAPVRFIAGYWQRPFDEEWADEFRSAQRLSIREINDSTDVYERETARVAARKELLCRRLYQGIGWRNICATDFKIIARDKKLRKKLAAAAKKTDDVLLRPYRSALLSAVAPEYRLPRVIISFGTGIAETGSAKLRPSVKHDQIVWARCPVRLDLAGGWSDTPPYTLRHGGQVTNCAVNLNGQPPIQVFCRRMDSYEIRIHSIDLGVTETITAFSKLVDYRDPSSPFGLPRAALVLLGLTPRKSGSQSLAACLKKLGCGIEITLLCAVPKGSGLGTSSILGATILAALHRFFGLTYSHEELFLQVLQMEQMLTTGGGWQDQIGGVAGGAKYIECKPGLKPDPVIHRLDPWLFTCPQTHGCFTLFYTGITRLAKNILQEVVAQVNSNHQSYLFTLNYVRELAVMAREALGLRSLSGISEILNKSWQSNLLIHQGTTNRAVNRLLRAASPYCRGAKLLGAGGGGYALFASENTAQAESLREMLCNTFENEKARIVDFSLNEDGLQVTVS